VPPRILIGAGAWVLGAVTATAGSLLAVDQLGQDLLAQQDSRQVSVATVNAELALERSERPPARAHPAGSPSPAAPPAAARPGARRGARAAGPVLPQPSPPGEMLVTSDGTAVATCGHGEAYLVYWSPQQGFEATGVARGPARAATVTFRGSQGGMVLTVTCRGDVPVKQVAALTGAGEQQDS